MKGFFHLFSMLGAVIGAVILLMTFTMDSAPQQGAGAAVACACAIIPYVFARSFELMGESSLSKTLEQFFDRKPKAN